MKRALAVLSLLCCALANGKSQTLDTVRSKRMAIYAPPPEYPMAARQRGWVGSGVFACNLRPMVPCHRWMYCKAPVMVSSIKQGFRRSGNGDSDPEGLKL